MAARTTPKPTTTEGVTCKVFWNTVKTLNIRCGFVLKVKTQINLQVCKLRTIILTWTFLHLVMKYKAHLLFQPGVSYIAQTTLKKKGNE